MVAAALVSSVLEDIESGGMLSVLSPVLVFLITDVSSTFQGLGEVRAKR